MRHLFLFIFLFIFSSLLKAQVEKSELVKNLEISDSLFFSNPDSSFKLYLAIEKQAAISGFKVELAKAYLGQSRYYILRTDYEPAGIQLNKGNEIYNEIGDRSGQADVMKLRSVLYERLGKKEESNKQLAAAIEIYRLEGDHTGMIRCLFNYSLNCIELKEFGRARWALDQLEALESWMSATDPYFFYQNSGIYEYATGNKLSAVSWFIKAKDVAVQEKMIDSYATATMMLGRSYLDANNKTEAAYWLKESYTVAKNNQLDHELSELLNVYILYHEHIGDFKNAFLLAQEQKEVNNRLFNLERISRINELENRIGLSKKEKELAEINLTLEHEKLNNEQISSQNTRLILSSIILILITGFTLFMFFKTRKLKNKISTQALKLTHNNNLLQEAYNDITNSIQYAKRIQDAILPTPKIVQNYLKESFILYIPKEIVAGDFYWMESVSVAPQQLSKHFLKEETKHLDDSSTHEFILFAACDCTGHGVPGAMVSVMAHNALNRAIREGGLINPASILDRVHELLKDTFRNNKEKVRDGMDISLCCLHVKSKTMFWSGANNPLWIVRENEIQIIEANKQSIGDLVGTTLFTNHKIELQENDLIYIFSDGFTDQFGENSGKKYKQSRFKELLLKLADKNMDEQRQFLKIEFDQWRGDMEQLDDICVIGVRIK